LYPIGFINRSRITIFPVSDSDSYTIDISGLYVAVDALLIQLTNMCGELFLQKMEQEKLQKLARKVCQNPVVGVLLP
jgi:hypothetical protein